MVRGMGFVVRGFRVRWLLFGVSGKGFGVECFWLSVRGLGDGLHGSGYGRYVVSGSLFRVYEVRGFGCGVSRFGVSGSLVFEVRGFLFSVKGF